MSIPSIPSPATESNPPFDPELSAKLDQANQREQEHAEAAIEHFIVWKQHLQAASIARDERRTLEAQIGLGRAA